MIASIEYRAVDHDIMCTFQYSGCRRSRGHCSDETAVVRTSDRSSHGLYSPLHIDTKYSVNYTFGSMFYLYTSQASSSYRHNREFSHDWHRICWKCVQRQEPSRDHGHSGTLRPPYHGTGSHHTRVLLRAHDGKGVVNLAAVYITCLPEQVSQIHTRHWAIERWEGGTKLGRNKTIQR